MIEQWAQVLLYLSGTGCPIRTFSKQQSERTLCGVKVTDNRNTINHFPIYIVSVHIYELVASLYSKFRQLLPVNNKTAGNEGDHVYASPG